MIPTPIPFPFERASSARLWMPPVRNCRKPSEAETVFVPPQLKVLAGSCLLAVVDDDNLRIGCQSKLSAKLSYRALAEALRSICTSVELHAVLTSVEGRGVRNNYFSRRGFHVLNVRREIVETASSRRVVPNDFDISFTVGASLARGGFDAVLLGTGDGDLALAIARGVRRVTPWARVYTLSVPGATSSRIQKDHAPEFIDGNLLVDQSLLRRLKAPPERPSRQKPTRRTQEGHHVA